MNTFTSDITASELKIKGELAIERLKDLEGAILYLAFSPPEGHTLGLERPMRLAVMNVALRDAIKTVVSVLNDACELVGEESKNGKTA